MVISVPLLPAIFMVSSRFRVKVGALCHRALAWALRLVRGRVCVRSTHAFVFSRCTHGKADSVLETFDLYADTHPSLCINPQTGQCAQESLYLPSALTYETLSLWNQCRGEMLMSHKIHIEVFNAESKSNLTSYNITASWLFLETSLQLNLENWHQVKTSTNSWMCFLLSTLQLIWTSKGSNLG